MAAQPWVLLLACLYTAHQGDRVVGARDFEDIGQRNILQAYNDEPVMASPQPAHAPLVATTAGPGSVPEPLEGPLGSTVLPATGPPREALQPEDEGSDGAEGEAAKQPEEQESPSGGEEDDHGQGCGKDVPPRNVSEIAHAMMMFATNLMQELELEHSQDNLFYSPLSIILTLAHLSLGAANETEQRILEVLQVQSVPCIHQALHAVSQKLSKTALTIAARIFLEKSFAVKKKFLEDSEKFYGAKPATLSGDSEADLATINNWVKEATGGQISTMLSDLPENVMMILLNAVHFRGFWETKFDPLLTAPRTFHLNEEFTVSVETMKAQMHLSWYLMDSLDTEVARFPFKGNTSFVVLAPTYFERNFSRLLLEFYKANSQFHFPKERPTTVMMPKLNLQYHLNLNQALSRLGLGELFSSPNLRPIAEGPLFVSSIQHRAAVELGEDGVEASAATSVVMSRSRSSFDLNRPYVFMIYDDITKMPLFFGIIQNPSPSAAPQRKTKDCALKDGELPKACLKDSKEH